MGNSAERVAATRDRQTRAERRAERDLFARARRAEIDYARRLRKIAEHVGHIIGAWPPGDPIALPQIEGALRRYADLIEPWATATARRMLAEVSRRDETAWARHARALGLSLAQEIRAAPTGYLLQTRLADQVSLIRSLPLDAAARVHRLTIEGIENSTRATEIAQEIMRSGTVARGRATLIARTETSRTSTELTRARAVHVGSTHFIWRSAGDSDVRPLHRKLNGHAFAWNEPPIADERTGTRALPGGIWNCRCYPEPVIPAR